MVVFEARKHLVVFETKQSPYTVRYLKDHTHLRVHLKQKELYPSPSTSTPIFAMIDLPYSQVSVKGYKNCILFLFLGNAELFH